MTWYAKEKDIFYQGTTDKELPLSTVVKYYYNGKETDAKDIIGKSGKIKIEIRLLNNSLLNKNNKFTPFVVAVGTNIDNETNKNISITNGKVTDTGSRNIAVAISSPGLYEYTNIKEFKDLNKVVISYETTDFEINDIYMVASPKLLSELDLDIFNKLDEFSSSIDTLSSKMDDIENGAKKLYDGSSDLVSGEAKFNSKLTYLATSLEKISNGTLALNDGIDEMIETLTSVKEMMANKDLNGSLANLQVLYQTNSATIKKISNEKVDAAYKYYQMSQTETEDAMVERLKQMNPNINEATLVNLKNVKSTYELKLLLTANNEAISEMITNLKDLNTLLNTLDAKLQEVKVMKSKVTYLNNSLSQVSQGLTKMSQTTLITDGISSLNQGLKELSDGTNLINIQGIKQLVNYKDQVLTYTNKFKDIANLSKSYQGFSSNNSDQTVFIYKIGK